LTSLSGGQGSPRNSFGQRRMVRLAAHRDHRLYASLRAGFDIRAAEIAGVREQRLGLAQSRRQGPELVQRRLDLMLVVGRLNHVR